MDLNSVLARVCHGRSFSNSIYAQQRLPLSFSTKELSYRRGPKQVLPSPPLRLTLKFLRRAVSTTETESRAEVSAKLSRESQELYELLGLLPEDIRRRVVVHEELEDLVEIVLDLGRRPLARFPSGDWFTSQDVVSHADLEHAVALVGDFAGDNRAGMDRTLHRVSAIRNRAGGIVGLTCRRGRAISGSAEMVRDLVAGGGSLLLMGPPGVGKTTAIRDVARFLADDYCRRVVVVDTSNEIGGDGDIPHPGIGRARRMQVPEVHMQHEIMIEAVENHMPQTIVIDEIGTELEALAAGTIGQRGVQLVGTVHGMTVENLVKNPSLNLLAGGIQSVTLGDEEARRRSVQKSILERKGPPSFHSAVEIVSRNEWHVHYSLADSVDALLAGRLPKVEVRKMTESGQVLVGGKGIGEEQSENLGAHRSSGLELMEDRFGDEDGEVDESESIPQPSWERIDAPLKLYTYQVTEASLEQVLAVMGLEEFVQLTTDIGAADAVLALRSKLKSDGWVRGMAKYRQLPIFAIKADTMAQMVRAMRTIFQMESLAPSLLLNSHQLEVKNNAVDSSRMGTSEDTIDALEEVRLAIEQLVIPYGQPAELLPRRAEIIALQVKLVEEGYQLQSEKVGTESASRLRILPSHILSSIECTDDEKNAKKYLSNTDLDLQRGTSVSRLPVLPG